MTRTGEPVSDPGAPGYPGASQRIWRGVSMRLLHAADLHVDSPLRGLSAYPGAPEGEIRSATRRALKNLVALAREEDVDAVLLAGDIYDGDWPDYNTGLFFRA